MKAPTILYGPVIDMPYPPIIELTERFGQASGSQKANESPIFSCSRPTRGTWVAAGIAAAGPPPGHEEGGMTRRMTIMLIVVGLLFGSVFGFQIFIKTMIKNFISAMPQPLQSVTRVTQHG
jgi:hypothetical protein